MVEDDVDDKDMLEEILQELAIPNEMVWFENCTDAFHYLKTTADQPMIIFSDVNLPGQNGIEFKRKIDHDDELRQKSIPFIFYSTSVEQRYVTEAYTKMTVQGFFQKKDSYQDTKNLIKTIIDYWRSCKHPNAY